MQNTLFDWLYPLILGVIWLYEKIGKIVLKPFAGVVKSYARSVFKTAGISVNTEENKPGDIKVHNDEFYSRLAIEQTLGAGEAYLDGWWDCDHVDVFSYKVSRSGILKKLIYPWNRLFHYLRFEVFNLQTAARSWEVAEKHYNLGNDLFKSFLDSTMTYSCGYWKDAKNLEEAQQHKMELIAKKLKLEPGMRVLDIGCGWGGLCKYLAVNYNVKVVGITVSKEGAKEAQERCQGLQVDIRTEDYRDLKEKFDRIVSVGMFEHVGQRNYRTFFEVADRCLVDDGIFLLHSIGIDNDYIIRTEPFQNKYIFPNGMLPYPTDICKNSENIFCIEDWHNFGADYDKTLMAWHANFVKNWPRISHLFEEPKRFYRLWTFYFLSAAGFFRARKFQLWQIVLTKKGLVGGYESVR